MSRLVDFLPAQAGEAILVSAEAEAPAEEPAETTEEIPIGDAGDPASAEEPLSDLAALGRDNPALADWIIGRIQERLAELGVQLEPEPDDPRRIAGRKPLGP